MSKMKKAGKVEIKTFFWASKVNFIKLKRAKQHKFKGHNLLNFIVSNFTSNTRIVQ